MRESPPHIFSFKSFRGAALAVASFSVLNSGVTLADGAGPTDVQPDYSVESASDTLAAILKDAQKKGFVRTKSQTPEIQSETNKQAGSPADIEQNTANAKADPEPFSCETAEVLDFSDLESFKTYDDLTAAKAKYDPEVNPTDTLGLARAFIALGLGDEALEILHSDKSARAQILQQAANIVAYPEVLPNSQLLSDYKDCGQVESLWAFLERPSQFSEPLNMTDIRNTYYALDAFPSALRERLTKSLAIAAAESDHRNLAQYLWERFENKAREDGSVLPGDHTSDYDFLYLSALLQKDIAPADAIEKFSFLSERESIYRVGAVKYLAEIKSGQGKALGQALEGDLEDISAQLKQRSGTQQAAYQLVSGQLGQNRLNDSIYSARSFLEIDSPEYVQARREIATLLNAHLGSESQAVQSAALDTFLKQVSFLKDAADWEDLKSAALEACLSLGLPELVTAIQPSTETFNGEQRVSLEKARILLALKAGTFGSSQYMTASKGTLLGLENKIMNYALMTSDLRLAKLALQGVSDISLRQSYELNLAWLEQDWNRARALSERQTKTASEAELSPRQSESAEVEGPQETEAILKVLAKPTLDARALQGPKWRKALATELSDMEDQIKISKAFLSHG